MDFIKADIESKKRTLDSAGTSSNKKYLKRSELKRDSLTPSFAASSPPLASPATATPVVSTPTPIESFNVTNEEAVRRLRQKQQPIKLFAESDKERRLRLRALELIEERTEGSQNDFARAFDGQELGLLMDQASKQGGGEIALLDKKVKGVANTEEDEDGEKKPKDEEVLVDLQLAKSNPHKIYPQIYFALKVRLAFHFVLQRRLTEKLINAASIEGMGTIYERATRYFFIITVSLTPY